MPTNDPQPAFDAALQRAIAAIGIDLAPAGRAQMFVHYQWVVETNRRFNLTRIIDPLAAAVKHYADSLTLLAMPGVNRSAPLRVLDVGTGAGFPAVPLAVACPCWRVLAIDGTGKKAAFVAAAAAALGLDNLATRHARAADLARDADAPRARASTFDLVLLRAVGKLALGLVEVSALLARGGRAVFYKTPGLEPAELADAERAAKRLRLTQEPPLDLELSLPDGKRISRRLIAYRS